MSAPTDLLKAMPTQCAENQASLGSLIKEHLSSHPGFAMSPDCISAALEDLEELVKHTIELMPTDPDKPPAIPAWDLPETEF